MHYRDSCASVIHHRVHVMHTKLRNHYVRTLGEYRFTVRKVYVANQSGS